jgi:hypothetical protein
MAIYTDQIKQTRFDSESLRRICSCGACLDEDHVLPRLPRLPGRGLFVLLPPSDLIKICEFATSAPRARSVRRPATNRLVALEVLNHHRSCGMRTRRCHHIPASATWNRRWALRPSRTESAPGTSTTRRRHRPIGEPLSDRPLTNSAEGPAPGSAMHGLVSAGPARSPSCHLRLVTRICALLRVSPMRLHASQVTLLS